MEANAVDLLYPVTLVWRKFDILDVGYIVDLCYPVFGRAGDEDTGLDCGGQVVYGVVGLDEVGAIASCCGGTVEQVCGVVDDDRVGDGEVETGKEVGGSVDIHCLCDLWLGLFTVSSTEAGYIKHF